MEPIISDLPAAGWPACHRQGEDSLGVRKSMGSLRLIKIFNETPVIFFLTFSLRF